MEAKKTKKADLEPKKVIFMQIGLIFALAVVLLAFNYRSYEGGSTLNIQVRVDDTPEEIIPITEQKVKPPPPPPPKQVTVINIVKDDVVVEDDIEIDVEADQETVKDDFIPVFEEEEEVDIEANLKELAEIDAKLATLEKEMAGHLRELGIVNGE